MNTDDGLYASTIGENGVGPAMRLPVSGGESGTPTVDGGLVAWWEGSRDETSGIYSDQMIYAMRLPDGSPVKVVDSDRSPYYPRLSGDALTWVRPEPENGDVNREFWVQAIYRITLADDGSPQGGVRRQTYREIVARRFDDDTEQVLARLEAHPLVAAPLAASAEHIAFVGDDGRVKLFEWRAGS